MEPEQKATEEKGCCRKDHCCGCKAVAALVLLLVGGTVGFFMGSHCGRGMCPLAPAAQSQTR